VTSGSHDDDLGLVFRCDHCGGVASCREEWREELMVLCPRCGVEVTREFRRAYFAGVSADIHARMVERDNREFLVYLEGGWPDKTAD
jgi:hypothetical protein